jgi:hypothetical protein
MKKPFACFIICFSIFVCGTNAQILSTSNKPSQTYGGSKLAGAPHVYGVFAGRIPCQEIMKELNTEVRPECAKRKVGLILHTDSVTGKPGMYEIVGMGKWTGKGKWHILRGTPHDPQATIFQLDLGPGTFLFLLKGDDNVLFILDRNKHFLTGNADYSYTLNRTRR